MMSANREADLPLSRALVEPIGAFPVHREVPHCGVTFQVSRFDIYTTCPLCKTRIKLRSFAAATELEDVFDAVLAWMLQPGAEEAIQRRKAEIAADADSG